MKISNLLFLGCLLCVSVYDVRGNVRNILHEFKNYYIEYVTQKSSNLTCFNFLKNLRDPCPCAVEQLQKIQDGFQNENSTEVVMMTNYLKALKDQLMKSGKPKDQSKSSSKQECRFMCWDPESAIKNIDDLFYYLKRRKCFKGARK